MKTILDNDRFLLLQDEDNNNIGVISCSTGERDIKEQIETAIAEHTVSEEVTAFTDDVVYNGMNNPWLDVFFQVERWFEGERSKETYHLSVIEVY